MQQVGRYIFPVGLAVLSVGAVAGFFRGLLLLYGHGHSPAGSLWIALSATAVLGVCLFLYGFIPAGLKKGITSVLLAVMVLILASGFSFAAAWITEETGFRDFLTDIPLISTASLLVWMLAAVFLPGTRCPLPGRLELPEPVPGEQEPEGNIPECKPERLDKISVKTGTRIAIVAVADLYAVGAYGDYVLLHTEREKLVKEQTMKYFECALPPSFIRIHRSAIINTDYIARVELLGKETYNVHLRNGLVFRASAAGYKLLKTKLSL